MTFSEVRKQYLEFFAARGHKVMPSSSIVPENDPTTLFTGSGMQPMVPYLLGATHPLGKRIVDSQKCFRAEDIEEVGDNRHTTFFEMLGNWSLGDYWKREQLSWLFEFLTDIVGLNPKNLYTSVFIGDPQNDIPKDEESARIWKELFTEKGINAHTVELDSEESAARVGMQGGRIFYYNARKNWWSRAGVPENMPFGEPGGPDSEIFFEFEHIPHNTKFGEHCHPNCDCGRFMEIGNSVFMEYKKTERGFEKLVQQNVDFGGGLERIAAAAINSPDIFTTTGFSPLIAHLERASDFRYADPDLQPSFRIIADHMRGAAFMISEGVTPSNTDRGYIVRRLLRRAVLHADILGIDEVHGIIEHIIAIYEGVYPQLEEKRHIITDKIREEEEKFRKTLEHGQKELIKLVAGGHTNREVLSGRNLFFIYSTYGYPLELSFEVIEKHILPELESGYIHYDKADIKQEFQGEFEKHKELSRTATAGVFKGGLADHSDKTVRLHTATHLMNAALRKVLGNDVWQKGSHITPERTRFDFTHGAKLTEEEKQKVEDLVNGWIERNLMVKKEIMPLEEARKLEAIGTFGEKYPDTVSVYSVYDPATGEVVSREFCGGPHVEHTGVIGKFKIIKEEAVASGIRRIKAVVE